MPLDEKIKDRLSMMGKLPTLPGIAVKILEVVRNENAGLSEISDIISSDPPLSVEVLKMVNSPFFDLPSKISTVHRAASLLGINAIKNLALGFSLIKKYRKGAKNFFNYTEFWKKSLTAATVAKLLSERICPNAAEDIFCIGLLHDIGTLAIVQCMPDQYSAIKEESVKTECAVHDAEQQILGFDHTEIGEYLTHHWGFPETFSIPIRCHHQPELLGNGSDTEIELYTKFLHLSSAFIDFIALPDKPLRLALIEHYTEKHGFSGAYDLDDLIHQMEIHTAEVFPLFDIQIDKETDYSVIIEEARKELISSSNNVISRYIEQQRQIEKLRVQAAHDGLTGLINYQEFYGILEKTVRNAGQDQNEFSVIISDIDYFKQINDIYGHLAGDYVLKSISRFLKDSLKASDIVARYGGEEFGFILPETTLDEAIVTMEKLRKALSAFPMNYERRNLSVTMSFGITSCLPHQHLSAIELIKKADAALYHAKRTGRDRCCAIR